MMQFHQRTLALLGSEGVREPRSVQILLDWAMQHAIHLPAAFLEWARFDDGTLLQKYSNDDRFWFDDPKLVVTDDGVRGLRFNRENQGNFDRIICLDQGDDPPVLFAWVGHPPWVKNADRFSDAVYAQVFDWQYWLEFMPNDPDYKEITYYAELNFSTDRCLAILRKCYEETVTTGYLIDHTRYTEYRFLLSPILRLTVVVRGDGATNIRISGRPMEAVERLETELASLLGERSPWGKYGS